MISKTIERFCKNYVEIENYEKAIADTNQTWACHHRLETHNSDGERRLIDITTKELMALDMYYDRPSEELIFLTSTEHRRLHSKGERNPMHGKHHSEESKHKMITHHNKNSVHKIPHTNIGKKHISEAKKGKPNNKIKGRNNGIHKIAIAYKDYKSNGGTEKWKAFQIMYKKLHEAES